MVGQAHLSALVNIYIFAVTVDYSAEHFPGNLPLVLQYSQLIAMEIMYCHVVVILSYYMSSRIMHGLLCRIMLSCNIIRIATHSYTCRLYLSGGICASVSA